MYHVLENQLSLSPILSIQALPLFYLEKKKQTYKIDYEKQMALLMLLIWSLVLFDLNWKTKTKQYSNCENEFKF